MKKIKKKKPAAQAMPAFLVGWTHGDVPPPGYLSAWFDQLYGGPLQIRFLSTQGHQHFEATHTSWKAQVELAPSAEKVQQWNECLHWEHPRLMQVTALTKTQQADQQDHILHLARIARGLTLLLEGTTYDVGSGVYRNPSDWKDHDLCVFQIDDHIQVEQHDQMESLRTWVHTRGLQKFGLDEIETFHPMGVSGRESEPRLYQVAEERIAQGKNLKIGEPINLGQGGGQGRVVRHRTDSLYGRPIAFREIQWDSW